VTGYSRALTLALGAIKIIFENNKEKLGNQITIDLTFSSRHRMSCKRWVSQPQARAGTKKKELCLTTNQLTSLPLQRTTLSRNMRPIKKKKHMVNWHKLSLTLDLKSFLYSKVSTVKCLLILIIQ
jgi:hypothetical protein